MLGVVGGELQGGGEVPIGDSFSATHPIARSGTAVFMEVLDAKGSDAGRGFEYYASWVPQSM